MRLVVLLAAALLLAGCIVPEKLVPASTQRPPPPAEDDPRAAAPPASTPPSSTPPASETRPANATSAPPPANASTPANATTTPASPPRTPPSDHHFEESGWIEAPELPAAGTTLRVPVPVQGGASNLTVRVDISTTLPTQRTTANVTIELVGPDGAVVARAGRSPVDEAAFAAIELSAPPLGELTAIVTLVGVSDGATMGDQYRLVVHVTYPR